MIPHLVPVMLSTLHVVCCYTWVLNGDEAVFLLYISRFSLVLPVVPPHGPGPRPSAKLGPPSPESVFIHFRNIPRMWNTFIPEMYWPWRMALTCRPNRLMHEKTAAGLSDNLDLKPLPSSPGHQNACLPRRPASATSASFILPRHRGRAATLWPVTVIQECAICSGVTQEAIRLS